MTNKFKNEIKRIADLFSINESETSKTSIADKVIGLLKNEKLVFSDCPDGYFYNAKNRELYIFEHFQIDAARKTKKGSALFNKQAEASREFSKSIKKAGDEVTFDFTTPNGERLEYLVENFEKSYLKHYNNIELYKKNISEEIKTDISNITTKTCFVIEQIFSFSLMGYEYDEPDKLTSVSFQSIKEIIDLVNKQPIDYILSIVHSPITDGQVGMRILRLPDGGPVFVIDDPNIWHPIINFYTKENLIMNKYLPVNDYHKKMMFMEGKQFYKVVAHEKK